MISLIKKIFRKKKYFSGPYKNWEIAQSRSSGYDSDEIFEKVKISANFSIKYLIIYKYIKLKNLKNFFF